MVADCFQRVYDYNDFSRIHGKWGYLENGFTYELLNRPIRLYKEIVSSYKVRGADYVVNEISICRRQYLRSKVPCYDTMSNSLEMIYSITVCAKSLMFKNVMNIIKASLNEEFGFPKSIFRRAEYRGKSTSVSQDF